MRAPILFAVAVLPAVVIAACGADVEGTGGGTTTSTGGAGGGSSSTTSSSSSSTSSSSSSTTSSSSSSTSSSSSSSGADLCMGVTCTALDTCHLAGTCDPSTGMCSNPWDPAAGDVAADLSHNFALDEASGTTAIDAAGTSDGTLGAKATWSTSFDGSGAITVTPTETCDQDANVDFGVEPGQLGLGDFTVSFWMKTTWTGPGKLGDIIGNRTAGSGGNYFNSRLLADGTLTLEVVQDDIGTSATYLESTPVILNDGAWHHVAFTRQSTTTTMYIDAVAVDAQTTTPAADLQPTSGFRIGRQLPDCYGDFDSIPASFDKVRIYKGRVLGPCDIGALFAAY